MFTELSRLPIQGKFLMNVSLVLHMYNFPSRIYFVEMLGTGQQGKFMKELSYKQRLNEFRIFQHGKEIIEGGNMTKSCKVMTALKKVNRE